MNDTNIELLILDYAGVCTPSALHRLSNDADDQQLGGTSQQCAALVEEAQQAGIEVVILSNEVSTEWAKYVPLLEKVDHVVACSDNNIFKPDRRAFQRCLLLTGAEAERTLVVDDEVYNITVAASLGMQTVLFNEDDTRASWSEVAEKLS